MKPWFPELKLSFAGAQKVLLNTLEEGDMDLTPSQGPHTAHVLIPTFILTVSQ